MVTPLSADTRAEERVTVKEVAAVEGSDAVVDVAIAAVEDEAGVASTRVPQTLPRHPHRRPPVTNPLLLLNPSVLHDRS